MNLFKVIFFSLLLGVFIPVVGQVVPQTISPQLDQYLQVIHQKMSFSGEVLVAEGNQVLYHRAVGFSSYEDSIPLQKGSTYRIASITKTFTGALLVMAQQQGKINFDDEVGEYIPELIAPLRKLTLHQLLTHTSGLPHNEAIEDYWRIKSKKEMSTGEVVDEINKLKLLFTPGSHMKYSTPGYYLLGVVIARVHEQSYASVLDRLILNSLQMEDTGIEAPVALVKGYHLLRNEPLPAPYRDYSMLKGAGDMYATADDLHKWSASFFTNKWVDKENISALLNPDASYGYGWFTGEGPVESYYHGGGTWGYSSHLAIYPQKNISVIILSNVSTLPVKAINKDIEKIAFGLPFEMPVLQESVNLSVASLAAYVGIYQSATSGMQLTVQQQDGSLFAKLGGNPPFEIYPKGNAVFFGKKVEVTFDFQQQDTVVTGVEATRMGRSFQFKKQ